MQISLGKNITQVTKILFIVTFKICIRLLHLDYSDNLISGVA